MYCGKIAVTPGGGGLVKKIGGINVYFISVSILCTVAAVEISDRKDLNALYKFRNWISVNRIFFKDYKVSVSI
jgi:hypothetical protein